MYNEKLSNEERIGVLLLFVGVVLALFINSGIYPLYLEEPRRALITLEMMYSDNWWVPTEFGEYYYKKPPFWNWLQMVSFKIFGANEFGARFFGILSFLGIGFTLFWVLVKYLNQRIAVYASLLFLTTANGLIYMNSAAGEIDLFYCLITFWMFVLIFHLHQRKKVWWLFLVAYFLTGVGLLTKGVPSLVFIAMTLLGLFISQKQFKKLISLQHISGILLMCTVVLLYAYNYHQFNDFGLYFQTDDESLIEQSAGKSFLVSTISSIVSHLFTFPFTILFDLLPASILIIFVFQKDMVLKWWQIPLFRFFIITFVLNLLVYWLSPLTRTRYIYMLYPIPIALFVFAFFSDRKKWMMWVLNGVILLLLSVLMIGGIALPFIPSSKLELLNHLPILAGFVVVAAGALMWVFVKKPQLRLLTMIGAMVLIRIIFDFTASPIRAVQSDMLNRKIEGQAIGKLVHPETVYIYKDSHISHQRIFYIEQTSNNFVRLSNHLQANQLYLIDEKYLNDIVNYESLYEIAEDLRKGIPKTHLIRIHSVE